MAGNIFWKEQAIVTLTSALGALVNNGGGVANGTANLDCRTAGNAAEMFTSAFELTVQWGTVTSITSGTIVGDLYLVPAPDGTNFEQVQIANASTDFITSNYRVGSFVNAIPSGTIATGTNYLFGIVNVDLQPLLYKPYIINRSGQTYTANATLKVVAAQVQYT
jgi:hypothetical protein